MNRAICGLLASAVILSAGARVARAEKPKKVVVEQFSGTAADKFKRVVVAELGKQGIEVVSDKKRAATEAELGLLNVSDNYAAVAKELGVGAFVDGTVTGSKHLTARLKVKGPDGAALGSASWTGANDKKLLAAVDDSAGKKLAAIFNGGAAKEEAAPAAEAAAPAGKEVAEEAPAPKKKSRKAAKAEEEAASEKPAKSDDAEAVVADSAEPARAPSRMPALDIAAGAHVYGRTFSYNQPRAGGQQGYHLPAVPAPTVSIDYFFHPNFGISVGAEYSVALISEDSAHNRYRTSSMAYSAGLKGRYALGSSTELTGNLGFADNTFKITPDDGDTTAPQVAAVDYKQIRAGAGVRINLGPSLALIGGGDYLHLLSMGELKDTYFKFATGRGGQGYAGVAFSLPWAAGLEGRLTADVRRYVFSMNSDDQDLDKTMKATYTGRIAGGATDQYIGANISLGFRR
jgi:hypothetical protein